MKHKHYEMIVAKAANMDLVVFVKSEETESGGLLVGSVTHTEWSETGERGDQMPCFHSDLDYFLCLPQHKEAVFNSLSGGESQLTFNGTIWGKCNLNHPVDWSEDWWYMKGESQSRIKPKKEKRWVGYCANRNQVIPHAQDTKQLAINYTALHYSYHVDEWQFIEIEIEVTTK